MPDPALLLVADGRWPLDADAARTARELEIGTGAAVTVLRVPADRSLYDLAPAGVGPVVVVVVPGTSPISPPSDSEWTRPTCWHAAGGCSPAWRNGVEGSTDTITEFVAPADGPAAGPVAATALALVVGGGCVAVGLAVLGVLTLAVLRRAGSR